MLKNKNLNNLLDVAVEVNKNFYTLEREVLHNSITDFEYFVYNHPECGNFLPKEDYDIVLLYSGGVDSFIAYHYAKSKYKNVKLIFVDYGQMYAKNEYEAIKKQNVGDVEYIDIKDRLFLDKKINDYGEIFPGRNWMLAIIAADYIKSRGEIWMVAIGGEVKAQWGDKSELFFSVGSSILSRETDKHIIITSPFKNKTKGEIVKWYLKNNLNVNDLLNTVSCHFINDEEDGPCGECMGCAHRYVGLAYNDIIETNYKNNIIKYIEKIYTPELENPFSEFSIQRKTEILKVLGKE